MKRMRWGALILGIVWLAAPAGAGWPPTAQKEIVQDAITVSPKELKVFLEKQMAQVLLGMEIPLVTIRDIRDQTFYSSAPTTGAVRKTAEHTAAAAAALRANDEAGAAKELGVAATYAAAIVQPRRFAGRESGQWEFHSQLIPTTLKLGGFTRPVKIQDMLVPAGRKAAGMADDHQSDTERYEMALKLVRDVWIVAWLDGGREIEEDLTMEHAYKRAGEARAFTVDMVKTDPATKPTVQAVRRWIIPFDKRQGLAIYVRARLNNKIDATYHLDTGASLVTISRATVRDLKIKITPETERIGLMTANGAIAAYLVELESVAVGLSLGEPAVAKKVKVAVCSSCGQGAIIEGLLGLSFLNNFNYRVDTERGHLVLESK